MPLVVRPDGQRAEREDGVLADVPPGAQYVADGLARRSDRHNGQCRKPRRAGPELVDQPGLGRGLARRPARVNAAAVMARMTSMSRAVSRRISTRSRWPAGDPARNRISRRQGGAGNAA